MITITDLQLADLYDGRWRPVAGDYKAPAALARWDGVTLTLEATGAALKPETAAHSPRLARILALVSQPHAAPAHPAIAALEADYGSATAPLAVLWPVILQDAFSQRLAKCRACSMWDESGRKGRGLCNSMRCHCAHMPLWLASKSCPEGLWGSEALKSA